jgi:CheY-like chemotaxis protein
MVTGMHCLATVRILVVEDDATLRATMAAALSRDGQTEVREAGMLGEALTQIDEGGFSLILSDLGLPDRSGLELIGELRRRGLTTPVIFVSGHLDTLASQIPPRAGVSVLAKPFRLDELRASVSQQLRSHAPFSVADYMQLAARGHHSVVIHATRGDVVVHDGQPWSASDSQGVGLPALGRLLECSPEEVWCTSAAGFDRGPRSLEGSVEVVLLDAFRRGEEHAAEHDGPAVPQELGADFEAL